MAAVGEVGTRPTLQRQNGILEEAMEALTVPFACAGNSTTSPPALDMCGFASTIAAPNGGAVLPANFNGIDMAEYAYAKYHEQAVKCCPALEVPLYVHLYIARQNAAILAQQRSPANVLDWLAIAGEVITLTPLSMSIN